MSYNLDESEKLYGSPDQELQPAEDEMVPDDSPETGTAFEVICVCEECNNRWDDLVAEHTGNEERIFCPLCGSQNVLEI
jgi:C4-type Zn-finger protein